MLEGFNRKKISKLNIYLFWFNWIQLRLQKPEVLNIR